MIDQWTNLLGRNVQLRATVSDRDVWAATFVGLYHVPPVWMPAPRTVLDLGANIGLTAAHYEKLWPGARILAVEMDDANAAMAARNWPGGAIIPGAVVADLDDPAGYNPGVAAEAFALGSGAQQPAERYTLAMLCEMTAGLAPVDFCKMDIEGMEWQLFRRGREWAPLVRHLLVELHEPAWTPDAARSAASIILQGLGYESEPSTHPAGLFAWRP